MIKNNLHVLVVDPEPFHQQEIVSLLETRIRKVLCTENGATALEMIKAHRPDIVITDLVLPNMSSDVYLKGIRAIDDQLPIMVLFDGYNPSSIMKSLDYNVSGFLKKPIEKERLYQQLWRVAKEVLLRQKLHETKSILERTLDFLPSYVALVRDGAVSYMNQKLLDFLGFDSFLESLEQQRQLGDFILELNGKAYQSSPGSWIRHILNDPLDREHLVKMTNPRHPDDEGRTFAVQFNEFHQPGVYLFSFSDVSELQKERNVLENQASIDPLTGALNRRKFLELLSIQEVHKIGTEQALSVIMFDIDHFKKVNDTYGHDVGDSVLKEICTVARGSIRDEDHLCRWGGEEFMILLSGGDLRQARALAERLRSSIEQFAFTGLPDGCTSSFGVAQWQLHESQAEFLKRVDVALYEAKETGRNKVIIG